MHDFKYKANKLYCEQVRIEDLVYRFGSPLYVYSHKTLIGHYLKLKRAFRALDPLICFSVKANSNLGILRSLVKRGAGLDVVSGGELYRASKAGCPARRIVYASVGKTNEEIRSAIKLGILFLNAESIPELRQINHIAGLLRKRARVAIRINPDVAPGTHKFITTGKLTNKFGIDFNSAYYILRARGDFANVDILGLHIHIGSQITEAQPFVEAIQKLVAFLGQLRREGINLGYLNIGGGLGIIYNNEKPQTADDFARQVLPMLKNTGLRIIMEPGRFIAGNAGILVVKVLYVKETAIKKFIIVDGAMNDLIRPALYGAYHNIMPLYNKDKAAKRMQYDVVGPICESGDFFAKERMLPRISQGDLLAVMGCGAYGFSMSSNYNSRLRAAEVMVVGDKAYLIRKREGYGDLVKNELMPKIWD